MQWNDFIDQQGPLVYRTSLRIVGQAADAEDVVQDVFLEVHRLWNRRSVDRWPSLLKLLATRWSIDLLRRKKSCEPLTEQATSVDHDNPERTAEAKELQEIVRQEIARLPQQQATLFALHYLENQSHDEIAEAIGMTPRAVASALHKARRRLESRLEKVMTLNR
jgi:RNA polymerase sigma-70 factor (ECF subfamily)